MGLSNFHEKFVQASFFAKYYIRGGTHDFWITTNFSLSIYLFYGKQLKKYEDIWLEAVPSCHVPCVPAGVEAVPLCGVFRQPSGAGLGGHVRHRRSHPDPVRGEIISSYSRPGPKAQCAMQATVIIPVYYACKPVLQFMRKKLRHYYLWHYFSKQVTWR